MCADIQSVKPSDLDKLEELVNKKIQAATPVIVTVYEEGDTELRKVSYKTCRITNLSRVERHIPESLHPSLVLVLIYFIKEIY
jgi:hypothetical protein